MLHDCAATTFGWLCNACSAASQLSCPSGGFLLGRRGVAPACRISAAGFFSGTVSTMSSLYHATGTRSCWRHEMLWPTVLWHIRCQASSLLNTHRTRWHRVCTSALIVESHKVLGACSLLSAVEILSYERGNLRLVGMITLMKDKEFTPATPGFRDPKHVGESSIRII